MRKLRDFYFLKNSIILIGAIAIASFYIVAFEQSGQFEYILRTFSREISFFGKFFIVFTSFLILYFAIVNFANRVKINQTFDASHLELKFNT